VKSFGSGHSIIARAFAQAAAMGEQVAHLHMLGDPGIGHAEVGKVTPHGVVPTQLSFLHQTGEQRRSHRLAVGGDLEQRVVGDRLSGPGHALAQCARVDHLAVVDHAHRETGQVITGHHRIDDGVELR
jgi:hypothetical protein